MNTENIATIAAPGDIDTTFGPDGTGIVKLSLPGSSATLIFSNIVIDSSNRLYAVGTSNNNFVIVRLTDAGEIDSSFNGGFVSGKFTGQTASIGKSLILLEDGRILLVASTGLAHNQPSFARFHENGQPDTSFGDAGQIVHRIRPEEGESLITPDSSHAFATETFSNSVLQNDGKILTYQSFHYGPVSGWRVLMFRFNSNGSLDTTLNGKGYLEVTLPGLALENIRGCMVDEDGRPMLCGSLKGASGSVPLFIRYNINGSLDTSFGSQGLVTFPVSLPQGADLVQMINQRNKKILGIGYSHSPHQGVLISLESDGTPNIQFNRGLPLLTKLEGFDLVWSKADLQPDGKIVVAGNTINDPASGAVVARLVEADFDLTFADRGWVRTQPEGSKIFIHSQALRATDGKICLGGYIQDDITGKMQGCILRYNG